MFYVSRNTSGNNNNYDPLMEASKMIGLYQQPQTKKVEGNNEQALANTWSQNSLHGQYMQQADETST